MSILVDTHCHLDFERFDEDRDQVVIRALESGVGRIIVPALALANCPSVIQLTKTYPSVFAAVGVHPNSAVGWQDQWIDAIREHTAHQKVVAIGEIGLDYYWDKTPKSTQQRALRAQLDLAADMGLPVIIHNRESNADLLHILSESRIKNATMPGVLHSFSGSWNTAKAALDMGFYLGFTGPVTFKKANELRDIAAKVPLDRILVETDAPFLAPEPRRGKRNEPAYVTYIAAKIAGLHHLDSEDFALQTTANAFKLFGIGSSEI